MKPPIKNRRNANAGFTLIELLFSLSIIAVLIALLLPALQTTREETNRSRTITTLNGICAGALASKDRLLTWSDLLRSGIASPSLAAGVTDGYNLSYTGATAVNTGQLIAEPAYPGITGSTTITMRIAAGCPVTQSVTPKSDTERRKMFSDLLAAAALQAGMLVDWGDGNSPVQLHQSLTGTNIYTGVVKSFFTSTTGGSVSFNSLMTSDPLGSTWAPGAIWRSTLDMVKTTMRLGAAGENYMTFPSIPYPSTPYPSTAAGTNLFSHTGMLSIATSYTGNANAVSYTLQDVLISSLMALNQSPTEAARDKFIADVNSGITSGVLTIQEADALKDLMMIVY